VSWAGGLEVEKDGAGEDEAGAGVFFSEAVLVGVGAYKTQERAGGAAVTAIGHGNEQGEAESCEGEDGGYEGGFAQHPKVKGFEQT
jgi:hypothetical protein